MAVSGTGDDWELLRRYALARDEAAFEQIVRRHVDLVFSSALRRVKDRQLAEDVTQAVFVILARKARSASGREAPMSAWLLMTVRYAAANAIKMEARRSRHERAAAATEAAFAARHGADAGACSSNPTDVLVWHEIAAQLDDAVLKLPSADRQAVLLRYFEGCGVAEVAATLNVSEGAAKQRLSRALDKLRQRLSRRGVGMMSSIDGAALAGLLASHAVRTAPAGLVSAACAAATGGAAATGAGIGIAKGAMTMMTMAKTKLAAAAVIGVMVIGGAGGVIAVKSAAAQPKTAAPAPAALAAKPQADAEQKKKDDNGVSVANAPPVVVATTPQAGSVDVDSSITEIKVTYSKDMRDGTWSWSTWGEDTFPKTTGKPHYEADKRTCVLPVKLEPGHTYAIWLNSNNFGNFKDAKGNKAVAYLLVFETK